MFWATEKSYLEAWSCAEKQAEKRYEGFEQDRDGAAIRKGFIPNWTSREFGNFAGGLGKIIDDALWAELA